MWSSYSDGSVDWLRVVPVASACSSRYDRRSLRADNSSQYLVKDRG